MWEFTGHRWIPRTKASDAELWCFLDLHLNKRLSKQSWGWWFKTPSGPLWRHFDEISTQRRSFQPTYLVNSSLCFLKLSTPGCSGSSSILFLRSLLLFRLTLWAICTAQFLGRSCNIYSLMNKHLYEIIYPQKCKMQPYSNNKTKRSREREKCERAHGHPICRGYPAKRALPVMLTHGR